MHGEQLAPEGGDDVPPPVHHHVEGEGDPRRHGDGPYVGLNRISVDDSEAGTAIAYALGIMEHEHRVEAGETRGHHLRAS